MPTLQLTSLKRIVCTPAGALPLVVVCLGAAGTLWAEVSWAERLGGFTSFAKLLAIPLFLYHFSRSDRGSHVLIGFLVSCVLLLSISWLLWAWPNIPWPFHARFPGVPVKDYIAQGAIFTICIFTIAQLSSVFWRKGRHYLAGLFALLALVFLANVLYVATSRTYLIVIPILLVVFSHRQMGWKGATGAIIAFFILAAAAWPSAPFLRQRLEGLITELQTYQPSSEATSVGQRLTYLIKSAGFVASAPIVGHGTGSISQQFRDSVTGKTGTTAKASTNPHNQIVAVGIQLGLIGIATLVAMWAAHLVMFRPGSFAAWLGLVIVVQNIIGSLFNSHLFDFTHGWIYVVGVGVAGGIVLKKQTTKGHLDS